MFRTILLGILVNIAIMLALSFIISIFGIDKILFQYLGGGYPFLFAFCLFWGMGGAFISLLMSKWIAKRFNGVELVSTTGPYGGLARTVHTIASRAGIDEMPEVGIYNSPDVNAFATGSSKNNSLVAVSTGLLQKLNDEEIEGVLAHEVSHIANGDMVTMTVVQGIVNSFVMFFAYVVAEIISNAIRGDDDDGPGLGFFAHFLVRQLLMGVFGFIAWPVVAWFSRFREYRADSGSADLVGKYKMINALEGLKRSYPNLTQNSEIKTSTMNISSKINMMEIFSTHPTLEKRIAALK